MNKTFITGNLTKDPVLNKTSDGKSVATLSVAVNNRYKKGEEGEAIFLPVVVWNTVAESCCKYLRKGNKIIVEGAINKRNYVKEDGDTKEIFEIVAKSVEFASKPQISDDTDE